MPKTKAKSKDTSSVLATIRALRDDPDDTKRLVLADELQQRGDSLGELIVVQCELAALPKVPSVRRFELTERAQTLVDRNCKRWLKDLSLTDHERSTCTFARGFPSGVTLTVERFLRIGEEIFDASSFGALMLTQLGPLDRVKSASLARVARLQLQVVAPPIPERHNARSLPAEDLQSLFASDTLCERLRVVDLSGCGMFETNGLEVLAHAPALGAITSLDLASTFVEEDELVGLCASKKFPALASLDVSGNRLGPAVAKAIGETQWPLEELECGFGVPLKYFGYWNAGQMSSAGLEALAKSGKLAPLSRFVFDNQQVGDDGIETLAKVPFWRLEHLSLAGNVFQASSIRTLLESNVTSSLVTLDLSVNASMSLAIESLARAKFPKLATFKLSAAGLDDRMIERLCAAPWMAQLVEIDVSNNDISRAGERAIRSACPNLALLEV